MESVPELVSFRADGLALTPRDYAERLAGAVTRSSFQPDSYGVGGIAEVVANLFAAALGKEAGLVLPTGTMANALAIKTLAGTGRVLAQADSHVFADSGDGLALVHGISVLPLARGEHEFGLDEVRYWVEHSASGHAHNPVTAISIETPVRRHLHQMVDWHVLEGITSYARARGIRLHMDGARLFNLPLHSGRAVKDYAQLFDTVYVSLRKHFNALGGAVLVGDAAVIQPLKAEMRRVGGALPHFWPQIALVPERLQSYASDYARAWHAAQRLIVILGADPRIEVRRIEGGTSVFLMSVRGCDPLDLVAKLKAVGIDMPKWDAGRGAFPIRVNPTLLRRTPEDLARSLIAAIDESVASRDTLEGGVVELTQGN